MWNRLSILAWLLTLASPALADDTSTQTRPPNVILIMMDDLGWADAGYQGHPVLKTPHLDAIAKTGIRFDRFYASSPVCSPTRASCLTGRHPYRYGITGANVGHLPEQEKTLAEILREHGYRTGHFGKWHLGTLTRTRPDSNRGGPRGAAHYAPPWEHGFDVCFSTEAKVPTFDPMITPAKIAGGTGNKTQGEPYGTAYWTGPDQIAGDGLEGDNSRIIMDRAIPFIEHATREQAPFLAVIWLHTPHLPIVAGDTHRAMYPDATELEKRYFGCVTAADEQIGRVRTRLRELGIADNTMLWFCSDNGPEGQAHNAPGSAGPLRGRKRSLYEGGVRVPGLLEWPSGIDEPRVVSAPCSTLDYVPTILDALDIDDEVCVAPLDGVSLLPLMRGEATQRGQSIGFQSATQAVWMEDQYKFVRTQSEDGPIIELFDLHTDAAEQHNIATDMTAIAARMGKELTDWQTSCAKSLKGEDYDAAQLPRVLLLGDSISMGYHNSVVDALAEIAVVVRPKDNCEGTTKGAQKINEWLALEGGNFDLIHFNFGLHDLKRVKVAGGRANSNNPDDPHQADLAAYERNLREIVSHLETTGATLIFATTTPVPSGGVRPHRDPADVAKYNEVARRIMREHGVLINDLNQVAKSRLSEIQKATDVHFSKDGSRLLGDAVADVVHDVLSSRADPSDER